MNGSLKTSQFQARLGELYQSMPAGTRAKTLRFMVPATMTGTTTHSAMGTS